MEASSAASVTCFVVVVVVAVSVVSSFPMVGGTSSATDVVTGRGDVPEPVDDVEPGCDVGVFELHKETIEVESPPGSLFEIHVRCNVQVRV